MKKKQFMSKLAALTMAAAMGLTAVPATATSVLAATAVSAAPSPTDDQTTAAGKIAKVVKDITIETDDDGTALANAIAGDDGDAKTEALEETGLDKVEAAIKTLDGGDSSSAKVTFESATYTVATNTLQLNAKVAGSTDNKYDGDYTVTIDATVTKEDEAALAAAKEAIASYSTSATNPTDAPASETALTTALKELVNNSDVAVAVSNFSNDGKTVTADVTLSLKNGSEESVKAKKSIIGTAADNDSVTVTALTQGDTFDTMIKTCTVDVHNANFLGGKGSFDSIFDTAKNNAVKTDAADVVKGLLEARYGTDYTISDVAITDPENWTYKVTDKAGTQESVTVKAGHTYTLTSDVTDLLDEYFENTDYTLYKDQSITTKKIANDLNNATKNKDLLAKLKAVGVVSISGDETLVKDGKGTLKVTVNKKAYKGTSYAYKTDGKVTESKTQATTNPEISYTFAINLDQKTDDEKTALKNAIATLNGSTYADPGDEDKLESKIAEDLVAAGAPKGTSVSDGTYKAATATEDGSWYINVDNTVLNITLKYSSASKLSDTDKAIRKALTGATKGTLNGDSWYTGNENDGYETKTGTTYTYGSNSKFSLGLQKKDATTAAKIDDIKAAVEKAVTDQLTAAKVTDNGVKVTEVYRASAKKSGTDYIYDDDAASKAATSSDTGDTYVVVSATIRNDFYGWTKGYAPTTNAGADGATTKTDKNVTINYLVDVQTGMLKSVETTALALDDQVVELVPNVDYNATQGRFKNMIVTINPTVTPEGGNDKIDYVLKNQYGKDVTTDHQGTYVDADGNKKTTADNEFIFSENDGGKYTVEICLDNAKDVKASASLTIKDSFNDSLDKTKYYYGAVKWAYQTKISDGVGDYNFGVNQTTSRAQFVTWMYKIAEKAGADMTVADTASKFTDVASTAYYANAVAWATQHGIVSGTTDTTFSPNEQITRGQMATMIYRLDGSDVNVTIGTDDGDATVNFTDIAGKYYTTPITWAANRGIVKGKTTTTFAPNDDATRAEAITVLFRAYGKVVY